MMNTLFRIVLMSLCIIGLASPAVAEFNKRLYVGLGGGSSKMSPDENDTGYVNDEDSDTAAKIYLGYDLGKRWSVEGQVATLGEATFVQGEGQTLTPPSGAVDYQAAGLSALYYLINSDGTNGLLDRSGLSVFAKLGVGLLDTDSDELEVEQLEDAHLLVGAGVEYGLSDNLAVRGEFEAFDEDAQMLTLGFLWRFGDPGATIPAVSRTDADATNTADSVDSASTADSLTDTDVDGVPDTVDACPATAVGADVDASGCPRISPTAFNGVLEGVTFKSGSSELTEDAMRILDQTAESLLSAPDVRVAIMAHTDNQGSAAGNLELSKKRALSVSRYLVSAGVEPQRLQPEAYGESQPMVSNASAEGRTMNRRIELRQLN